MRQISERNEAADGHRPPHPGRTAVAALDHGRVDRACRRPALAHGDAVGRRRAGGGAELVDARWQHPRRPCASPVAAVEDDGRRRLGPDGTAHRHAHGRGRACHRRQRRQDRRHGGRRPLHSVVIRHVHREVERGRHPDRHTRRDGRARHRCQLAGSRRSGSRRPRRPAVERAQHRPLVAGRLPHRHTRRDRRTGDAAQLRVRRPCPRHRRRRRRYRRRTGGTGCPSPDAGATMATNPPPGRPAAAHEHDRGGRRGEQRHEPSSPPHRRHPLRIAVVHLRNLPHRGRLGGPPRSWAGTGTGPGIGSTATPRWSTGALHPPTGVFQRRHAADGPTHVDARSAQRWRTACSGSRSPLGRTA